MRRGITYLLYLVIVILLIGLPSLFRFLRFNSLARPEIADPPVYEPVDLANQVPTPGASNFVDEPVQGSGQILLDQAHDNRFVSQDIAYLEGRLSARGYELVSYQDGDLANALRPANAFIVVAPMIPFKQEEVQAVQDFVSGGGRLFLVGDPTRFTLAFEDDEDDITPFGYRVDSDQIPLNSLANEFDLNYNGDYVYNTVNSEGNYRNIIIGDGGFEPDLLTSGLGRVTFYGSHSIQVDNDSLALLSADEDTWSSATDRPGGLVLAALNHDRQVLAVGDIDFLTSPYYTVFDNSRFIAQIADFLVDDGRSRTLADFPYFFGEAVDLVFSGDPSIGPDAFDEIIAWQKAFRDTGRTLSLAAEASESTDTIYIGLYNQAEELEELLTGANITLAIEPPIEAEDEAEAVDEEEAESSDELGESQDESAENGEAGEGEESVRVIDMDLGRIQMSGTALILLTEEMGQSRLVLLAASAEGLENTAERLISLIPAGAEESMADCLLQNNLALCPTNIVDEAVEAELLTGGPPEVASEEEPSEETGTGEGEEGPPESEEPGEEVGPSVVPDSDIQGEIVPEQSVEGLLEADQAHAWLFSSGPALVNIILQPEEPMDGILELYDPEGSLIGSADSGFTAGEERLEFVEIADDQVYTIVVRDFYEAGGDYTLMVELIVPEDLGAVDQGELPVGETVEAILEEAEIHSWTFAIDNPALANITLTPDPELDALLVLFDPDGQLVSVTDETLNGEVEQIENQELNAAGEYTLVVGGFTFGGGSYSLLLELGE